MEIYNAKGRRIRLDNKHFLTEGGEGRLFAVKDRVYKIYHDRHKVIAADKLDQLARLDRTNIIRPLAFIYDNSQQRIGFSMAQITNSVALPRLFTTAYWNANAINPSRIAHLVKAMQETIGFIHRHGCLQVDGNEFNYMASHDLSTPYFIDVDSFQTPGYPASAIMPSIRDYTQNEFNETTDWFSFAVVAFQMFVGIHPFKGRHADFKQGDFEGRIKAGLSVFHKEVSYPASVRDFSLIPKPYLDWFKMLFHHGSRDAPPSGEIHITVTQKPRVVRDGARTKITKLASYDRSVRRFSSIYGQHVVHAGNSLYIGKRRYAVPRNTQGVVILPSGEPMFLSIANGSLVATSAANQQPETMAVLASRVFVTNNVPYVVHEDDLIEINITQLAQRWILSAGLGRKILPNATQVFTDILVENVLGKTHVLIPVRFGVMPIVPIPELDAFRIIDARQQGGVAVFLVADKQGQYQTVRLRFSPDYTRYDCEIRTDIEDAVNFTVLDKGVIVSIPKAGMIEITSATLGQQAARMVEDPQIALDLRLANDNGRVVFTLGKALYHLSLNASA